MKQIPLFARLNPPLLRDVTRDLRQLNREYDGPGPISLGPFGMPVPTDDPDYEPKWGREEIPGDDRPFDAVRCARRLIAALKAGELAGE